MPRLTGHSAATRRLSVLSVLTTSLLGAAACSTPPGTPRGTPTDTLRILTYNIHIGIGTDRALDLERIARVIAEVRPHVVALQEVDSATRRTGGVDQAAALAALTGLRAQFARAMAYDGGAYGVALLFDLPVDAVSAHPLPADSGHEPRVAAEARLTLPRTRAQLVFFGTHLDHTANVAVRRGQVDRLLDVLPADTALVVLAGDLNAIPTAAELAPLMSGFIDAAAGAGATFPASSPLRRIDYVLLRPASRFRVLAAQVLAEPNASDHRPVLVVAEVRPH